MRSAVRLSIWVVEKAAGAVSAGRDLAGKVGRAGVLSAEGFEAGGVRVAENAGQEADNGVQDDEGG